MDGERKCRYDPFSDKLLYERQQCACIIQEIGSKLQTTQVVINSALYFMHHFYQSFAPVTIKPVMIAVAASYCACKTEDFSRKISFLIRAMYDILHRPPPEESSDTYRRLVSTLHALEAQMLMCIGFKTLEVIQPHVVLITVVNNNRIPVEIAQPAYYVCTNMLHLTTLWLRHSAQSLAAASLYIAAKWSGFNLSVRIPDSSETSQRNASVLSEWYTMFGKTITLEEIHDIVDEFTLVFQACDTRIKETLRSALRNRKLHRDDSGKPSDVPKRLSSNEQVRGASVNAAKRPNPSVTAAGGQPIYASGSVTHHQQLSSITDRTGHLNDEAPPAKRQMVAPSLMPPPDPNASMVPPPIGSQHQQMPYQASQRDRCGRDMENPVSTTSRKEANRQSISTQLYPRTESVSRFANARPLSHSIDVHHKSEGVIVQPARQHPSTIRQPSTGLPSSQPRTSTIPDVVTKHDLNQFF